MPSSSLGCEQATGDICSECIDQDNTYINEAGQCVCSRGELSLGAGGYCQHCYVPGCKTCFNMNPNLCSECLDSSAILSGGVCTCINGLNLEVDGMCSRNP